MSALHRIKIRVKDIEIEVEASDRAYVESKFDELKNEFLGKGRSDKDQGKIKDASHQPPIKKKDVSLQEFLRLIKPKSGTDYAVAIAYFTEKYTDKENFDSSDIRNGFMTAKFRHSNPTDTINKAKSAGKVMDAKDKGTFVLTQSGEKWVEEKLQDS